MKYLNTHSIMHKHHHAFFGAFVVYLILAHAYAGQPLQPIQIWGNGSTKYANYSSDCSKIIIAGYAVVQVFDAASQKRLHWILCNDPVISRDGTKLIQDAYRREVKIFDTLSGTLIREVSLKNVGKNVHILSITSNGEKILGEVGKTYHTWNALTGDMQSTFSLNANPVYIGDLSPDGTKALCGTQIENLVYVWDTSNGHLLTTLRGHHSSINFMRFTADGKRVLTGASDYTARIWDSDNGNQLDLFNCSDYVSSVDVSPDGSLVIMGIAGENIAEVWDQALHEKIKVIPGNRSQDAYATFSPDGLKILAGSTAVGVPVKIINAVHWNTMGDIGLCLHHIKSVAYASDGNRIFAGYENYALGMPVGEIITIGEGAILASLSYPMDMSIDYAAFNPDGDKILTNGIAVLLWDSLTGHLETTFTTPLHYQWRSALSKDGNYVLTGKMDHAAQLWDAFTGELLTTYNAGGNNVYDVAFTPDGLGVLVSSYDSSLHGYVMRLLDRGTGAITRTFDGPTDTPFQRPNFSPDGKKLLTQGREAWLWDVSTGKTIRKIYSPNIEDGFADEYIYGTAFSPDGSKIVCSHGSYVDLYYTNLDKLIERYGGFESDMLATVFSPDGTKILSGSVDGTLWLWPVPELENSTPKKIWNAFQ